MTKILNQQIEIVNLHEDIDDFNSVKKQLEEEIRERNDEIYELNEKVQFSEIQSKLYVDEQAKSLQDIQVKLEKVFLNNPKKLVIISNIRNLFDKIKCDINIILKQNQIFQSNKEVLNF